MKKIGEQEENQSFRRNHLLEIQLSLLFHPTTLRQKTQIHLGKLKIIVPSFVTVKIKTRQVIISCFYCK